MDEQEEFEFRARREREVAAMAAPPDTRTDAEKSAASKPFYSDFFDGPQWLQTLKNLGQNAGAAITGLPATALGLGAGYVGEPIRYAASIAGNKLGLSGEPAPLDISGVKNAVQNSIATQPTDESGRALAKGIERVNPIAWAMKGLDFAASPLPASARAAVHDAGEAASLGIGLKGPGLAKPSGMARTAEAQRMLDQGIDLTPGQMNPKGVANKVEQVSEHLPWVGEIVKDARTTPQAQFKRLLIEKGAAPGTKISPADVNSMLGQAYDSFSPMYDQAKGVSIDLFARPNLERAFKDASANSKIMASNDIRSEIGAWLDNQVTALEAKPGAALDSAQLIDLRSNIRTQIREDRLSGEAAGRTKAQLLTDAERAVTKELNEHLTPEKAAILRAADERYKLYKVLESAVAKGKDSPGGFTSAQLSQAVKESTPEGIYTRGGGRFRPEARGAAEVFRDTQPRTGATLYSKTAATLLSPITAFMAGTKGGRRLAQGTTAAQRLKREYLDPETQKALQRIAIAEALTPQQGTQ